MAQCGDVSPVVSVFMQQQCHIPEGPNTPRSSTSMVPERHVMTVPSLETLTMRAHLKAWGPRSCNGIVAASAALAAAAAIAASASAARFLRRLRKSLAVGGRVRLRAS